MGKYRLYIILPAFFILSVSEAKEYRIGCKFKIPVSKKIIFKTQYQIRSEESVFNKKTVIVFNNSVHYSLSKRLKTAVGYRFFNKFSNEEPFSESIDNNKNRLSFDLKYEFPFSDKSLDCEYRFRFQSSWKQEEQNQHLFLRNRFLLSFDIHKRFQPFISDEIYIDMNKKSFRANKIEFGIQTKFNKRTKLEFYFINEIKYKQSNLSFHHITGINIEVKLF